MIWLTTPFVVTLALYANRFMLGFLQVSSLPNSYFLDPKCEENSPVNDVWVIVYQHCIVTRPNTHRKWNKVRDLMHCKPTQWDYILKTIKRDCGDMQEMGLICLASSPLFSVQKNPHFTIERRIIHDGLNNAEFFGWMSQQNGNCLLKRVALLEEKNNISLSYIFCLIKSADVPYFFSSSSIGLPC